MKGILAMVIILVTAVTLSFVISYGWEMGYQVAGGAG